MKASKNPRNIRHLLKLIPEMRPKISCVLDEVQAAGYQPVIAESLRDLAQQREKVRKGYSKTYNSYHLYGRATDIIDKRWGWHGPCANINHDFWKTLGKAYKRQGLFWGGDWRSFKDVAHGQLSWRSKREKREAMRRLGLL